MENNLYLSRFWTRVWAFLIDTIILGVFGYILGLVFKDLFISMGGNARIIGWIIALAYFTILNSKINNGQTLGKQLMHIQVVNIEGNAISLKTSLFRTLVFTTPFFLNGLKIPGVGVFSVITIIQSIIIFTLGFGMILFYIINKQTRQSIHDIITKTYVVQDYRSEEISLMPKISKLPFYILGALLLLTSISLIYFSNARLEMSKLALVCDNISKQENIYKANISETYTMIDSTGKKGYAYTIAFKTKQKMDKATIEKDVNNPLLKQVVEAFINSNIYHSEDDILNVVVSYGFDIGIASQTYSFNIYKPVYKWKEVYAQ